MATRLLTIDETVEILRTTVTVPPRSLYEYSSLYYGDWMARHERAHLKHIARILKGAT